jgi:hypothetical protein
MNHQEKGVKQIDDILSVMQPSSVRYLLTAIDNGRIAGQIYGIDAPLDKFCGCLVGWAGCLEKVSCDEIKKRVAARYKIRRIFEASHSFSWEAERFISHIYRGDLPANNIHLSILRGIVVEYIKKNYPDKDRILFEIPAPVKTKQPVLWD